MKNNAKIATEYDVIIIGAGAAGLFCGGTFPKKVRGLILEKTKRPGTKLLMSGNGQCNITHNGSIKDFVTCYGENGKKIRTCLYKYSNTALVNFLNENGVKTIIREDGKVFPVSMKAEEILNLLLKLTAANGFDLAYEKAVTKILQRGDQSWEVITSDCSYTCNRLILATGGCSYPTTGSDGSFFPILKRDLDIPITPLRPALTPINIVDYPYGDLSGIGFTQVGLSVFRGQKKVAENVGDLLLTHQNLSGPGIINVSKHIQSQDKLVINYLFPQTYTQVLDRLKSITVTSRESLVNLLANQFNLPKRFAKLLVERYGNSLKVIAAKLTGEEFLVKSVGGFNVAMATSGGIPLEEIKLTTMEVKNHPNLFVIGEMIDIDGITGGYNLQFAYSSARIANK